MNKWNKILMLAVGMAVLASWAHLVRAGDPLAERKKVQNRLLAHRAARADAIRKLSERINGLRISSKTKVGDFVTESDKIQTAMYGWLSGVEEVGKPQFSKDGTAKVTVQVPLELVVVGLQKLHKEHYKGNKLKIEDFEKITVSTDAKYIRETGFGLPRPELRLPLLVKAGKREATFDGANPTARKYWTAHCTPQGRLMAERAARLDAIRRLAERISGLHVNSTTTVEDFTAESDEIKTRLTAFINGMKEVGKRYHENELVVEVELQVKLRTIYARLKKLTREYYKGNKVKVKDFEKLTLTARDTIIKETGMGIPGEPFIRNLPPIPLKFRKMIADAPMWINAPIEAIGKAAIDAANKNKSQAKLMAFRAAEMDARRKLAEQINGLKITANTRVRDFAAESDEIETTVLTFQQGASVVEGSQKILDDGTVQVKVAVTPKPLWNAIVYYRSRPGPSLKFKTK